MRIFGTAVAGGVLLCLGCVNAGAWSLYQVGAEERSLEIVDGFGACEAVEPPTVRESSREVAVSLSVNSAPPGTICPSIYYFGRSMVRLASPLAGRHVRGASGSGALPSGNPIVPRLVGLSPSDAHFVLAGSRIRATTRHARRVPGLPRVIGQSPSAGLPVPAGRVVRLRISR
jgi:hypothetical protein